MWARGRDWRRPRVARERLRAKGRSGPGGGESKITLRPGFFCRRLVGRAIAGMCQSRDKEVRARAELRELCLSVAGLRRWRGRVAGGGERDKRFVKRLPRLSLFLLLSRARVQVLCVFVCLCERESRVSKGERARAVQSIGGCVGGCGGRGNDLDEKGRAAGCAGRGERRRRRRRRARAQKRYRPRMSHLSLTRNTHTRRPTHTPDSTSSHAARKRKRKRQTPKSDVFGDSPNLCKNAQRSSSHARKHPHARARATRFPRPSTHSAISCAIRLAPSA